MTVVLAVLFVGGLSITLTVVGWQSWLLAQESLSLITTAAAGFVGYRVTVAPAPRAVSRPDPRIPDHELTPTQYFRRWDGRPDPFSRSLEPAGRADPGVTDRR